ncbi:MAG: hypothetical protein KAX49_16550 [Halanaerobiales bacterium]|nr:hypothetical protein [Halanaerobiales bacterium]
MNGDENYQNYFIEADPKLDYSNVTRPRSLPLLTEFDTKHGKKHLWTTFSADQVDLNYQNDEVFLEILKVLLFYVQMGARLIRLDAIGFMWKIIGTTCIHLDETHLLIKVYRKLVEAVSPECLIITETNVPHHENISYFGDGYDEAHMVYQFSLPPLTLHAFLLSTSKYLNCWAKTLSLPSSKTSFFNFLASHDGIGMRPAQGLLPQEDIDVMVEIAKSKGGRVSYKTNEDGSQSVYELNINYFSALEDMNDTLQNNVTKFLCAHSILLTMVGMPAIYVHSLLGSVNDYETLQKTQQNRSINRGKLDFFRNQEFIGHSKATCCFYAHFRSEDYGYIR